MIVGLIALAALVAAVAVVVSQRRPRPLPAGPRRILFPFTGHALSQRALEAALRLAVAEQATLVPVFLARVPLQLPLDAPLPRQCTAGLPLLETIEQRAAAVGVPIDARVDRGRTLRHAMREAIAHERFDRLVAAAGSGERFHADDVAWLLDHVQGEVVIIRPADDDRLARPASRLRHDRHRRLAHPLAG